MPNEPASVLESLHLQQIEEHRYSALPPSSGHGLVEAGTLLALIALAAGSDGNPLRSVHADFFRMARPDVPVQICTNDVHRGRTMGIKTVSVSQGERELTVAQACLGSTDEDLLTHQLESDVKRGPSETGHRTERYGPSVRVVGNADPFDPDTMLPPRWQVWANSSDLAGTKASIEAFIAYHANQYLVSAAVLPHRGFGMDQAHDGVLTVITASTLVFHRNVAPGDWFLFDQTSTYSGGGWIYGRGETFDEQGVLVASFSEQAIMRRSSPRSRNP